VLLVFLVLAAKYESLFLPLAIILIVPMCLLSAITGVWLSGGDNNIFTQIGFFVLAGLACKNAILIVEFAHEIEQHGKTTVAAAIEAARLRLRPILMTSFAFIIGVVPLVVSTGAGEGNRRSAGSRTPISRDLSLAGTHAAGFVLTRQEPGGKWSAATYALNKTAPPDTIGHRTHRTYRPDGASPIGPMGPMPDAIDGAIRPGAEAEI
jgi:hypothetical protein